MCLLSVLLSQMPWGPPTNSGQTEVSILTPRPTSTDGMSLYGTLSSHSHSGSLSLRFWRLEMQVIHYNISEDPLGDREGEVSYRRCRGSSTWAGKGSRQTEGLLAHILGILYISAGIKRSKVGQGLRDSHISKHQQPDCHS